MKGQYNTILTPHDIEFQLNDRSIYYSETVSVPEELDIDAVVKASRIAFENIISDIEFDEEVETETNVRKASDNRDVFVSFYMRPGRPDGGENVGIAAIAGELMGVLAMDEPDVCIAIARRSEKLVMMNSEREEAEGDGPDTMEFEVSGRTCHECGSDDTVLQVTDGEQWLACNECGWEYFLGSND